MVFSLASEGQWWPMWVHQGLQQFPELLRAESISRFRVHFQQRNQAPYTHAVFMLRNGDGRLAPLQPSQKVTLALACLRLLLTHLFQRLHVGFTRCNQHITKNFEIFQIGSWSDPSTTGPFRTYLKIFTNTGESQGEITKFIQYILWKFRGVKKNG